MLITAVTAQRIVGLILWSLHHVHCGLYSWTSTNGHLSITARIFRPDSYTLLLFDLFVLTVRRSIPFTLIGTSLQQLLLYSYQLIPAALRWSLQKGSTVITTWMSWFVLNTCSTDSCFSMLEALQCYMHINTNIIHLFYFALDSMVLVFNSDNFGLQVFIQCFFP